MRRVLSVLLVLLVLFFIVPIVTVDKLVTGGDYTLKSGKTLHAGMVITGGEATIEEGARVVGGVYISSGVLHLNGEVAGGIFAPSGEVILGPRAVVGGHVKVTSPPKPFVVTEGARINEDVAADVSGWLGGETGVAIKLLVVAAIVLYRPALLGLRRIPGAPDRVLATRSTAVIAVAMLLIAIGVFLPLDILEISLGAAVWSVIFIIAGLLLFATMFGRHTRDGTLALPASVLTLTGLVLVYQAVTGYWESWAYAWALVLPMSLGVGQVIAGWWSRERRLESTGVRTAGAGVALFLLGALFFEGIIEASGAAAALIASLLLVGAGFYLLFGAGLRPGGRAAGA